MTPKVRIYGRRSGFALKSHSTPLKQRWSRSPIFDNVATKTAPVPDLLQRVELRVAQLDFQRSDVLLQVLERQGPWDGQHRRRALEEPRQDDLHSGGAVPVGDHFQGGG